MRSPSETTVTTPPASQLTAEHSSVIPSRSPAPKCPAGCQGRGSDCRAAHSRAVMIFSEEMEGEKVKMKGQDREQGRRRKMGRTCAGASSNGIAAGCAMLATMLSDRSAEGPSPISRGACCSNSTSSSGSSRARTMLTQQGSMEDEQWAARSPVLLLRCFLHAIFPAALLPVGELESLAPCCPFLGLRKNQTAKGRRQE